MYEEAYLVEVEELIAFLEQTLQTMPGLHLPDDYELVAQVSYDDEDGERTIQWQYYYVDHHSRSLFWLFPFVADGYLGEISGPLSPAHFSE